MGAGKDGTMSDKPPPDGEPPPESEGGKPPPGADPTPDPAMQYQIRVRLLARKLLDLSTLCDKQGVQLPPNVLVTAERLALAVEGVLEGRVTAAMVMALHPRVLPMRPVMHCFAIDVLEGYRLVSWARRLLDQMETDSVLTEEQAMQGGGPPS